MPIRKSDKIQKCAISAFVDESNPTCVWEFSSSLSSAPDESNMAGRIRRRFGVFPIWHGVLQVPFLCFGEEPVQEPTSSSSSVKILSLCESRGELIFFLGLVILTTATTFLEREKFRAKGDARLKGMRGNPNKSQEPPCRNPVLWYMCLKAQEL